MTRRLPSACAVTSRAQEPPSARYAFADTTLLRDTLNLRFDRLFPIADSLRISPGYLRMLSVRYRTPIERLVWLSDSLRMPVDSVGGVMERERFNPLAAVQQITAFSYNSSYQVTQEGRASWGNGTEYAFSRGPIHVRNVTNVDISRLRGALNSISRLSETSADWRRSRQFSAGARIFLQREQGFGYGPGLDNASTNNEYQLKVNTQQQPRPNLKSGFNVFLGPFDEPLTAGAAAKRGISSQMSGNVEYNHGGWLLYHLDGRLTSRIGRGRLPDQPWLDLREMFGSFRGNLSLYERMPVSVRLSHDVTRNRAENPDTTMSPTGPDTLQYFLRRLPSGTQTASLALNLRDGVRGSLTVTGEIGGSERLLKIGGVNRTSDTYNTSLRMDGRYVVGGWNFDLHFTDQIQSVENPQTLSPTVIVPDTAGGLDTTLLNLEYRMKTRTHNRSLDVTVDRSLSSKLSLRAKGRVFLGQPRSSITDSSYRSRPELAGNNDVRANPTEPRDSYEDALELQGIYTPSQRLTTSLGLEFSTRDAINLLAASSNRNTHIRTYRAQWSWSYRLMGGLTATQRNQLTSDYTYFPFVPTQNQLSMKFDVRTTLNAILNPRFRIDLTHVSEESPRGSYVENQGEDEGRFRVSSRGRAYQLNSNIAYTPFPALSLTLNPAYRADAAAGAGLQKSLNVAGGGSVNLALGERGTVSGNMSRTYTVRSSTNDPLSRATYSWAGSLQLTWQLQ